MARTTISIPDDLKRRMDKVKEPINWSLVAAVAFERKIGEIAARKKEAKNMQDVIDRLRGKAHDEESELYHDGYEVGEEWAKNYASPKQLQRLSNLVELLEWSEYFIGQCNAPYSHCDYLAFLILGLDDDEIDEFKSDEFWESAAALDHRSQKLRDTDFLRGFVEGADELWSAVANKL